MITIYGDHRSGNCLKVKYVADYLELAYDWKELDVMSGATRDEAFLVINPMGQIPAIMLDDGRSLAQSNAIMHYLATGSNLIPDDHFIRAQMDQWLFWEQYSHESAIAVLRFQMKFLRKTKDERPKALVEKGEAALDLMEKHLGANVWFVGEDMTLADIALFAYTQFAEEGGFDLTRRPAITRWLENIRQKLAI